MQIVAMLTGGAFAQIFIANRFCKCDISSKFKYFDNEKRKLLKSLTKDGIKTYLKHDCDLKISLKKKDENDKERIMTTQNLIIKKTLSKIICFYPKIYQSITSYVIGSKNNRNIKVLSNYHKIFNIRDLVICIFQYLNDIKSLTNCSMVDTIWLINSFNNSCTKYWELDHRISNANTKHFSEYYCMRQWLRFQNVNRLWIFAMEPATSQEFCNNVKWINFDNVNEIGLCTCLNSPKDTVRKTQFSEVFNKHFMLKNEQIISNTSSNFKYNKSNNLQHQWLLAAPQVAPSATTLCVHLNAHRAPCCCHLPVAAH